MLRYIEGSGLLELPRSPGGYRLYGPAQLQRLRTLRRQGDKLAAQPNPVNRHRLRIAVKKLRYASDALAGLCGKGVVLADVTSMWQDLLKRKSFHDLTGNGVNHPNDFGHRVYAQVISTLVFQ